MQNLVSVIIPCCNDGIYLEEAIHSVDAQDYDSIETIVVNDGSTDPATLKILDELGTKRSDLNILHMENRGPSAARNAGIAAAGGVYILPLDADDRIDATYIRKAVEILDHSSEIGICYCRAKYFGIRRGEWKLPEYDERLFSVENMIFVSSLFRRSDWEVVGGFSENMSAGNEDYDFWIKLIERGRKVRRIDEFLFFYRIKGDSRTARLRTGESLNRARRQLLENHRSFFSTIENLEFVHEEYFRLRSESVTLRSLFLWRLFAGSLLNAERKLRVTAKSVLAWLYNLKSR